MALEHENHHLGKTQRISPTSLLRAIHEVGAYQLLLEEEPGIRPDPKDPAIRAQIAEMLRGISYGSIDGGQPTDEALEEN